MTRLVDIELFIDGKNMPEERFGYTDDVEVVCLLNKRIVAFNVRKTKFLFMKPRYILSVKLPSTRSGRPFGNKEFTSLEDAIEFGVEFMLKLFPNVSNDR